MKIVVLDGYTLNPGDNPWDEIAERGELEVYDRTPDDQILERSQGAEVLFTNKAPLTAEIVAKLPKLRFVGVLATGYDVVDVAACREREIPVANIPVYGSDSVAQHVFALLLELCHHLILHDGAVRAGDWARTGDFSFWRRPLAELAEKTIGIVGFGRIGRRVGELAHAFKMAVMAHSLSQGVVPSYRPFSWSRLEELFEESDVVSLHLPHTGATEGLVNRKLLELMKPSAFFINTARGGLVKEEDLAEALNYGKIAGAAVDVVSKEPIEPSNPLLGARNCIITPHIAWATLGARKRLMQTAVHNLRAFQAGKPVNVVN